MGHWFVAGRVLFRQLDFTWRPGGVVGVVGPSGSGKSTLLSLLAGWEAPRQGVIEQSNVRSVRWVFQNPHGVPRRSALDHVALPLVALGASRRQAEREAAELLRRVGLAEVAAQSFAALSGGEAQRLMLARGLAGRPDLLLIDEPTAQLDRAAAREVDRALARLALDGVIVVVATHDPETRAICSQVLDLGQTPAPAADPIRPAPAPAAATWGGPPDRSQRPAEDPDQGHRDDGPEADHGPARGEEPSHRPERERRGRLPPGAGRPAANQRVRWAEVAREAWRNTVGGASKAAVWALLAALAWAACAWLDTRQTADLVTASADYLAGGGATWVLEAPGAVSGTACDGLASAAGVQAAGAWREEPDDLTLAVWPSAPLPLVSVTPGFLKLLGAAPAAGLALPDTLMTRLGLTPPATIASRDGPVTIGAAYAYPEDGRRTGLGYAAVSPTLADQPFDQCWLTVWPTDQSNRLLAWAALAPQGEAGTNQQPPKLSPLNP
ncbi:MAG: ATP-binding cassette domain-containing protein, partial [Propionibacteriaceae bacterium]|nr:ATP-binding cassette domain-containing protein [Propionibacteriaceae bacterium]